MPGSFRPITSREEREWLAYEAVCGSLDPTERLEAYLADIAYFTYAPVHDVKRGGKQLPPRSSFVHPRDTGFGKPEPENDGPPPAVIGLAMATGAVDHRPGQRDV